MNKTAILKELLKKNKDNADGWFLLGAEYLNEGSLSEALEAFAQALKSSEGDLEERVIGELAKLTNVNFIESEINSQSSQSQLDMLPSVEESSQLEETVDESQLEKNQSTPLKVVKGGNNNNIVNLHKNPRKVTFQDVGGLESLKEIIKMKIIKPFTNPGLFARFRKKTGGGILLFGPPGCGKTFIAKATAGECNAKFIDVQITDILNPYLGVSEQNVRDIFSSARASKPCVLFIDEIDTVGYNRSKSSSEYMRPIIDQLLVEMEGIDTDTDKLLIIGATNMPWDVDSAFKRPGRFDKMVFVPPPDIEARKTIFNLKLKDKPFKEIDIDLLAEMTELYSGADIDNVVEIATENVISEIAASEIERPILMQDLIKAIGDTKPSTVEWLRTIKNYVKYANQSGFYNEVEKFLSQYKKYI